MKGRPERPGQAQRQRDRDSKAEQDCHVVSHRDMVRNLKPEVTSQLGPLHRLHCRREPEAEGRQWVKQSHEERSATKRCRVQISRDSALSSELLKGEFLGPVNTNGDMRFFVVRDEARMELKK